MTEPQRSLLVRLRNDVELVRVLAPREVRVRYRQSLLDVVWALVTPVVVLAVYGYVLTQGFDVRSACSPYLSSAWTGLVVWTFFATATGGAVTSLVSSSGLVSKVYLPVEAIPLSVAASALVDLAIGVITLALLVVVQGVAIQAIAVASLLPLLVIVVWTAALSVLVAIAAGFARDVVHAVNLFLRVGFFATPVMYEAPLLPGPMRWTASVNPVGAAIGGVRDALLCGNAPRWAPLLAHLGVGLVLLLGGVVYARSAETRLLDAL